MYKNINLYFIFFSLLSTYLSNISYIWYFRISSLLSIQSFFFPLLWRQVHKIRCTIYFSILNLLISFRLCILLHTFRVFVIPSFSYTSFFICQAHRVHAIHVIFFFLSVFLFPSSHHSKDCSAISVGSDVTWKIHCPRASDRIICTSDVCISTMAYTGTVYIR